APVNVGTLLLGPLTSSLFYLRRSCAQEMKILHVWNTAGVGSIIGKYMDRLFGTESLVVMRKAFDPFGFTTYGQLWDCGAKMFVLKSLLKARKFDVIHVHSVDRIVPYLKLLYPDRPVVMHYHGDEIRDKWAQRQKYWVKADVVICATLSLFGSGAPSRAVLVPNPVDTEVFCPGDVKPLSGTALHFPRNADDLATEHANQYNLELTIYDGKARGIIPYLRLPEFLRRYEYYIDVKRNYAGILLKGGISKTGLEALSCGLKVIKWDGSQVQGLPAENRPENVARQVYTLYEGALSGSIDRFS
ncbi:MAG: glycosyltransferase, partial [Nitrososphaeria archaeon]